MKKSDIWVVIPVFNEAKYLNRVLEKVGKVTPNYLVVDDGSQDGSPNIARQYTANVLVHKLNLGKGAALKTGCDYVFKYLNAKAVVFIDSDDQHNPNELEFFFENLIQGSPMVLGERKLDSHMPLIRIVGNRFASVAVYLLFGRYLPDIPSGFKAMSKSTYDKIHWKETGYGVELEIAAKVAKKTIPFSVVSVTTIYHDLDRGMTILDVIRISIKLINLKITI